MVVNRQAECADMADAASCLVPGPTGNQTEPFVLIKKRHVFEPYPRKRINMADKVISGDFYHC